MWPLGHGRGTSYGTLGGVRCGHRGRLCVRVRRPSEDFCPSKTAGAARLVDLRCPFQRPTTGNSGAVAITGVGYEGSFTLSQASVVTGVNFVGWTIGGAITTGSRTQGVPADRDALDPRLSLDAAWIILVPERRPVGGLFATNVTGSSISRDHGHLARCRFQHPETRRQLSRRASAMSIIGRGEERRRVADVGPCLLPDVGSMRRAAARSAFAPCLSPFLALAALVECVGVVRVELDGLIEVLDGAVVLAFVAVDDAAIVVGDGEVRVALDGLVESWMARSCWPLTR